MELQDRRITLPYGEALLPLKQSLGEYVAHWRRLSLGVTTHPDLCRARHEGHGWDRMYLLYLSPRHEPAWALEQELLASVRGNHSPDEEVITRQPRDEPLRRDSECYVYLLLAGRLGVRD